MRIDLSWIVKQINDSEYEFSAHADQERQNDKISIEEIENALIGGEIIESYDDDPRGSSCLVLGYGNEAHPIHIVCGRTKSNKLRIITVYTIIT